MSNITKPILSLPSRGVHPIVRRKMAAKRPTKCAAAPRMTALVRVRRRGGTNAFIAWLRKRNCNIVNYAAFEPL